MYKTNNPNVPRAFDLLIYNRRDGRNGFDRGDIVDYFVHPKLGRHAHAGGKFHVITVRGVSENDILRWMEPETEDYFIHKPSSAMPIPSGIRKVVRRRAAKLEVERFSVEERGRLDRRERLEVTARRRIRRRMRNKRTGRTEE